jgi:hypothetical protein
MLLLVASCGNLYTGDESLYDPNHQDNEGDRTQLPVMVAFSDPIYNVLTRGSGVLNPTDETNFGQRISDGTFFVYAFRRDNPNGMTYAHRRAEDAAVIALSTAAWTKSPPKSAPRWDLPPNNASCTANGQPMPETVRSSIGKAPATFPIITCRKNSTLSTSSPITTTMQKRAK